MELCAIVISPVIMCSIAFPFDVHLSTRDDSAGKPITYSYEDITYSFYDCIFHAQLLPWTMKQ